MSSSIIENLFAPGDTPSGQYARLEAYLNAINSKANVQIGFAGSKFIAPGFQSATNSGEFRVAPPTPLWGNAQFVAKDTNFWSENLVGGATSTFQANRNCVRIQCTTANGDRAVRQSKPYIPFEVGRSNLIELVGTLGAAKANVTQRMGQYDDNNGVFIQQTLAGISLVTRTNATGSPVDTAVAQANWNLDKLDGTGQSGFTLDLSKIQKMFIFQGWPGTIGIAFSIGGFPIPVHVFGSTLNVLTDLHIATPVSPVRFEITNTAATASLTFIDTFTGAAASLGGLSNLGVQSSITSGITARSIGANATLPVLSIRMKSAYARGYLFPLGYTVFQTGTVRDLQVQLILGGTLTGGSFNSASTAVEFNNAGTSLAGGLVINADYTGGSSRFAISSSLTNIPASSDYAGTTLDLLTIQLVNLTGSALNAYAAISWQEVT